MDIQSRKNEKVVHFKKLASHSDFRRETGEYLCDGEKLFVEAVKWHADIRDVMVYGALPCPAPEGARVYSVTREVIEAASPLRTPQNVVFSVGIPRRHDEWELGGTVILENMQDPGNLGTILRTANAFGIKNVILTGDCADIYNPKTVRASMGAVFRQRVTEATLSELEGLAAKTPIYAAALRQDAKDVREVDLFGAAVAVGNEGSGITRELLEICAGSVIIPMRPECESLNAAAAAAVIMWEMSKDNI